MAEMTTITEVINSLRAQGYTTDFNLHENCLHCTGSQYSLQYDEFSIDKVYRFEGETDPADEATVYAISSDKQQVKGILVNGAGIYTDELTDDMLEKLQIKRG